jgi:hypothetical protein
MASRNTDMASIRVKDGNNNMDVVGDIIVEMDKSNPQKPDKRKSRSSSKTSKKSEGDPPILHKESEDSAGTGENSQPAPVALGLDQGLAAFLTAITKQNQAVAETLTTLSAKVDSLTAPEEDENMEVDGEFDSVHSDGEITEEADEDDELMNQIDEVLSDRGKGQKKADSTPVANAQLPGNKQLLEAHCSKYESNDTGPPINAELAALIEKMITTPAKEDDNDKVKDTLKRPENCKNLVTPRVNEEIWKIKQFKDTQRTPDLRLQAVQKKLLPGLIQVINVTNTLYESSDGLSREEVTDCLDKLLKGLASLTAGSQEVNNRRKDHWRSIVPSKYTNLCSYSTPVTTNLFGDEVTKTMKDLKEADSLFSAGYSRSSYGGYNSGSSGYNSNYNSGFKNHDKRRDFLGRGRGYRPYQRGGNRSFPYKPQQKAFQNPKRGRGKPRH